MDTSTWTLTHITFDSHRDKWRFKVERIRPPIDENERFWALGTTFAEALADAEAEIRRRDCGSEASFKMAKSAQSKPTNTPTPTEPASAPDTSSPVSILTEMLKRRMAELGESEK